jgi:putative membrane protein
MKNKKLSLVYPIDCGRAFSNNRSLHAMILFFVIVFIILSVNPADSCEWWVENITLLLVVLLLTVTYNKNKLTCSSYFCILICMLLHALGAHYTYPHCPIGNWMNIIFGFKRNNYDRIVGFAFGFFASFPVSESLYRKLWVRYIHACILSVAVILSACALYQLYEMCISMLLTAGYAAPFPGMQSDMWDAQNDIAAGFLGTMLSMGGCILSRIIKNHRIHIVRRKLN